MTAKHQRDVRLDPQPIGRRIREIRGFDLTQLALAEKIGVTQTQLSKYERGKRIPTPEILLRLKRFSGKTIDWILTGED